jgi:predicted nucleic acid-binding protein
MRLVVADASPINYLIVIDSIDVLRDLYGRVVIPPEVLNELTTEGAPLEVQTWIGNCPDWIEVKTAPEGTSIDAVLDAGEDAAIRLALAEPDCLLLIDGAEGRSVASRLRIPRERIAAGADCRGPSGLILLAGHGPAPLHW